MLRDDAERATTDDCTKFTHLRIGSEDHNQDKREELLAKDGYRLKQAMAEVREKWDPERRFLDEFMFMESKDPK